MNKEIIEQILQQAIISLFDNQPNIYNFTSETGQTEWNLVHHLANEIYAVLKNYDSDISYDLDVRKEEYHGRRPDIIFHTRGDNSNNLLIVEVKRDKSYREIKADIKKIKENWFKGNLSYSFGAAINLKSDKSAYVEVVVNSH